MDKHDILPRISGRSIDLGCGPRKRSPSDIGVDAIDYPGVDIVGDAYEVLARVPDGALGGAYSAHFLEHVDDVSRLLHELGRTVREGGVVEIVVPHFSNPYYHSDPTHRTPFGLYTFSYLADGDFFRRRVPSYSRTPDFRVRSVTLQFKSPRPFYGRYAVKRALQTVINATRWTQEFYEENLCYLFPCYELRVQLERTAAPPAN